MTLPVQKNCNFIRATREAGLITVAGSAVGAAMNDSAGKQFYRLTYKGWDYVLGTSASSAEHGRVFVAMWFDASLVEAYESRDYSGHRV